jgi:hypothetical protein
MTPLKNSLINKTLTFDSKVEKTPVHSIKLKNNNNSIRLENNKLKLPGIRICQIQKQSTN